MTAAATYTDAGWWVVATPRGPSVIDLADGQHLSTVHPADRYDTAEDAHARARDLDPDWVAP